MCSTVCATVCHGWSTQEAKQKLEEATFSRKTVLLQLICHTTLRCDAASPEEAK